MLKILALMGVFLLWAGHAYASCEARTSLPTLSNLNFLGGDLCDTSGSKPTWLSRTLAGEDTANDVQKVEQRFAYLNVTADVLVKSGPGFLHTITCSSDAAATAGTMIVYDNTAESGTIIWTWTVNAVDYQPRTLTFDVAFATGLYVGYTTTADVTCTVTYR